MAQNKTSDMLVMLLKNHLMYDFWSTLFYLQDQPTMVHRVIGDKESYIFPSDHKPNDVKFRKLLNINEDQSFETFDSYSF